MSSDKAKTSGKDTVYVDPDDDITSIIDKVEASSHKLVALVLPKRQSTLQSIVNMRLLRRSAESAGKNIVLITSEKSLMPLAGASGLHVAKNLQSAPEVPPSPMSEPPVPPTDDPDADPSDAKLDYHRSIGELAAVHAVAEDPVPLGEDEKKPAKGAAKPKDKKLKVPNFERFRLGLGLGIALFGLLVIFIIAALFILPKANVTITTESSPISANFNLTTSDKAPALDEAKKVIPASLKTQDMTSTQQVNATGTQNNGTKATGSVTMNAGPCGPTFPADVPAGTGISTNGLTYITQSTASFNAVHSGSSCSFQSGSVNITAIQAGSKYNTSISGANVSNSSATASGSASGGTDNNITVLSQSDVDNAKSKISDQDKNTFIQNFEKGLNGDDVYVITSSLKAVDPAITANPAVGQPASNATVTIKTTYSILTVKKSDLKKAITDKLNSQLDPSKQKISANDVVAAATVNVQGQSSPTTADLEISEDTTAIPIINVASIKKQIVGLKTADIKSKLEALPGVKDVKASLSPFWVSTAPKESKIHVLLVQSKQ